MVDELAGHSRSLSRRLAISSSDASTATPRACRARSALEPATVLSGRGTLSGWAVESSVAIAST